jgi:eukaryotic-like serine/threonine-protein kinase
LLAQIPADLEMRQSSTVQAMPIMAPAPMPAQPTTIPAMPVVAEPPRMPMSSNVTAPASAITASNATPVEPSRGPMIVATIVLSIALGLGVSYSLGWFGKEPKPSDASAKPAPSAEIPASTPVATTPKSKSALEPLQGAWKSSTGREYNAVLVGDVLEMRIQDVKPFAAQGYEQNEARLLLRVAPGKTDTFLVEDRLRPNAPTGSEYDPARARLTCLVPFSEIDGKPLEARLDNGQLRISMVLIKPDTSHYTFEGKQVTGCRNLMTAGVSPLESVLSRP